MTPQPVHVHPALVGRWVDGDTVYLDVDLDYRIGGTLDFRLYGIDAAEHTTLAGKAAIVLVNQLAPVGSPVVVVSYKTGDEDSFGRWLAEIFTPAGESINQRLIKEGMAVPYFGGTKPPQPPWPPVQQGVGK